MSELFSRSKPKSSFAQLSKMIHGFIKTGKSTFAAEMKIGNKEPLFIATEDGHHNLDVVVEKIFSWSDFLNVITFIEKNKQAVQEQHSCIILDLVSDLDLWCEEYTCKQLNIKNIADAQFAAGYNTQRKEFQKQLMRLWAILPLNFIAHSKQGEMEIDGVKYTLLQPDMSKNALKFINGKVDVVGFIIPATKKDTKPKITFRPTLQALAGSRYSWIAKEFDLSITDMKSSYATIEAEFTAGLKK
jgi:hypothetical protein